MYLFTSYERYKFCCWLGANIRMYRQTLIIPWPRLNRNTYNEIFNQARNIYATYARDVRLRSGRGKAKKRLIQTFSKSAMCSKKRGGKFKVDGATSEREEWNKQAGRRKEAMEVSTDFLGASDARCTIQGGGGVGKRRKKASGTGSSNWIEYSAQSHSTAKTEGFLSSYIPRWEAVKLLKLIITHPL